MPAIFSVSATLLACVVMGAPEKPPTQNVPEVLQRQTQALYDAIATGEVAVWDEYLDAGVRFIDESGDVMSKKQMLEGTKPLPEGVSGTIRVTDFDVALHGEVAIATYVNDENEVFHGHALHCRYRTTDTWMKTAGAWRLIASQILALRTDPPSIVLPASVRAEYCGRYALTPEIGYEIRATGDALEGRQSGRPPEALLAEAADVLFVPGRPRYRYVILRGSDGKITGFAQRREAWDLVWTRE